MYKSFKLYGSKNEIGSQDTPLTSTSKGNTLLIDPIIIDDTSKTSRRNNKKNNRGKNPSTFNNRTKIVFYYLMLVPSRYSSLYFNRKEITTFFKLLDYYYKDYSINNNLEKKERAAEYSTTRVKRDIKRLPEFKDSTTQEDFQKVLLKEYRYRDSDQLFYTIRYLEKYVKDFKALTNRG